MRTFLRVLRNRRSELLLELACRRAGLRQLRCHDMRHSFGSQLAMAGVFLA